MPALPDRAVLAHVWTEEIIRDHLDRDMKDISDIVILSPTVCLIFKGQCTAKEGFSPDDLREILDRVNGGRTWASKDIVINAIPVTVAEAHHILATARLFAQNQRKSKRLGPRGVATPANPCTQTDT